MRKIPGEWKCFMGTCGSPCQRQKRIRLFPILRIGKADDMDTDDNGWLD